MGERKCSRKKSKWKKKSRWGSTQVLHYSSKLYFQFLPHKSLISSPSFLILYDYSLQFHPLDLFHFKSRSTEERFLQMKDTSLWLSESQTEMMLTKAPMIVSGLIWLRIGRVLRTEELNYETELQKLSHKCCSLPLLIITFSPLLNRDQ